MIGMGLYPLFFADYNLQKIDMTRSCVGMPDRLAKCEFPFPVRIRNAYQLLYMVDQEDAKEHQPEGADVTTMFGKTLAAIFAVEYDHHVLWDPREEPYREVDILHMLTKFEGTHMAW